MKSLFSLFLFFPILAVAASSAVDCEVKMRKRTLESRGNGAGSYVFHFSARPAALTGAPSASPAGAAYRTWLRGQNPGSAKAVLRNSMRVREEALSRLSSKDSFRHELQRDLRNLKKILSGEVGHFREAQCLDEIAFREFLKIADLRKEPQEFLAYVFVRGRETRMIADFDHKEESAVIGVRASSRLEKERKKLRQEGWAFYAHLHNHPFHFENPYGDVGGALAPSDADLESYRALRPRFAWITNGVDVFEIPLSDLKKLEVRK